MGGRFRVTSMVDKPKSTRLRLDSSRNRKRVLVLSSVWPIAVGNISAAEVVVHEIARLLAAGDDFEVAFMLVNFTEPEKSAAAQAAMDALAAAGARFLPMMQLQKPRQESFLVRNLRILFGSTDGLIPGLDQGGKIVEACRAADWIPDIVVPVWSEVGTAAASGLPWPTYAYYGNPDHKVMLANLQLEWRWARRRSLSGLARYAWSRLIQKRLEQAHVGEMRKLTLVGDVANNDAEFYRSAGVNAYYVNNMWPTAGTDDWRARRDAEEQTSPLKIAASIGRASATGNTYGLWAIGEEILPALKRRFPAGDFELHVYGRQAPRDFLQLLLADPAIRLRGFVEDIDKELLSCPIFLIANNRYNFKVGHTRFLHAWSLGACVVAWRDSALAMPEIVHNENVLLADTADEMAELVAQAASDTAMRRHLGEGGRRTLAQYYRPESVVAGIAERIRSLL